MSPLKVFSSILITLVIPALPAEVCIVAAAEGEESRADEKKAIADELYNDAQQGPAHSDSSENEKKVPVSFVVYVDAWAASLKRGSESPARILTEIGNACAVLEVPTRLPDEGPVILQCCSTVRVLVSDWPVCLYPHGPPA
jgi:hypothetical protein